jgi:hypothetical protein
MSTLTVQEIFTRIQRAFGDEAQAQVTQADVIRWINDAMREIANNNNLLQVKATANTTNGVSAYALPVGIARLYSVKFRGLALESISLAQADELIGSIDLSVAQGFPVGTPTHYWIWAGQINLYPAPDTTSTTELTLYYTRQATPVVNLGDVPEVPEQYHNRIVEYCMARAYELDENFFIASMKDQKFEASVDKIRQDESWKNQELYPFITSPAEEVNSGWYFA